MGELQTIPARHGVATFVPAGQVIKIVNTSGTQVVDTWAFALPAPDSKKPDQQDAARQAPREEESAPLPTANIEKKKKKKQPPELPSQEEAEKTTREAQARDGQQQEKKGWSSYVPSVPSLGLGGGGGGGKKTEDKNKEEEGEEDGKKNDKDETEQQKNSRAWGSYFTAGKGFTSYIPKQATDSVSQFASYHERDKSKTYLQQLQDFSQTPVGAAGWKAMSAVTGSGYSGSLYAGYQAWNAKNAADQAMMEFMSMSHTRAATLHLRPRVNDVLVTNVREPILTLVEDSSTGVHDTLIAACDPARYRGLGVPKWEEHGSCAENLVLALKELNERAGLKGVKAVGAQVTVNNVPAPLNLFMNIPWDDDGSIGFMAPKSKPGDYVRFKAERDTVVVMSACPQDVLDINGKKPREANFVVEESEDMAAAIKRTTSPAAAKKKEKPATTTAANAVPKKKPPPPQTAPPSAKKAAPISGPGTVQKAYTPAKKSATTGPQPVKPASQAPASISPPAQTPIRPKKKPIPPPVKQSRNTSTSGEPIPVEKKKPRKLVRP